MGDATMARDVKFLNRAINVAKNNTYNWHLGSVIARRNRFIVERPNRYRNSPLHAPGNASVHAEEAAIKAALSMVPTLNGCSIYVARFAPSGKISMARPCKKCMKLIIEQGIRRIVYTNEAGLMSIEKISEMVEV